MSKLTPEFLQSCTNEQINKGVAWLESREFGFNNPCEFMSYDNDLVFKSGDEYSFSPCTSPNDAWPIIDRSGITSGPVFTSSNRIKIATCKDFWIRNENGLRAAMEVYILMECSK